MAAFRVVVPFDPVIHETTESRTFTQLPDSELAGGVRVHRTDTGYSAELTVDAAGPGAAKVAGLATLERFLAVLAAWNYAFQIHIGGVRADPLERRGDVSASALELRPQSPPPLRSSSRSMSRPLYRRRIWTKRTACTAGMASFRSTSRAA